MARTVLWQVKGNGSPAFRCELELTPEGLHRIRVVKGRTAAPVLEHEYADRPAALEASITIYRGFKDKGFHDTPRPLETGP